MLKLTVNYKNGNTIENKVNYLHFENGCIFYTVDEQVHGIFQEPVRVPLENIVSYDLEEVKA